MQTASPIDTLEPFFFGEPDAALFACFHPPAVDRPALPAALICPPAGYEGIRAHRAGRQLAAQLAAAGLPTLRFDYFASGDSAGEDEQASLARWRDDVAAALAQLRRRAGRDRVALVGLRLGASLAAQVGAGAAGVEKLVLWHPIAQGRACLEQWRNVQREFNRALGHPDDRPASAWPAEIQGFRLADAFVAELESLDLASVAWSERQRVLVVADPADDQTRRVVEGLRAKGIAPDLDDQPGPRFWDQEPLDSVVPFQTLRRIVAWAAGEARP